MVKFSSLRKYAVLPLGLGLLALGGCGKVETPAGSPEAAASPAPKSARQQL